MSNLLNYCRGLSKSLLTVSVFLFVFSIASEPSAQTNKEDRLGYEENSAAYFIKNAWIFNNKLFVLYTKEFRKFHRWKVNILNPHQTFSEDVQETNYITVEIDSNLNDKIIDLNDGIQIQGLTYIDDDFTLIARRKQFLIKNKTDLFEIPCSVDFWGQNSPVRLSSSLFFCGNIIPIRGKSFSKMSSELIGQIREFINTLENPNPDGQSSNAKYPAIAFCAKDGDELLVFPAIVNGGYKGRPESRGLSINLELMSIAKHVELPEGFYPSHDDQIFSQNGLVVSMNKSNLGEIVLFCKSGKCNLANMKTSRKPYFAVLNEFGTGGVILEMENVGGYRRRLRFITFDDFLRTQYHIFSY